MKVVLYGILRSIAGTKTVEVRSPTIAGTLKELSDLFGRRMHEYLYEQDSIESLTVVLNGRVLSTSERSRASLGEDDVLELLSPIGGG